MGEKKREGKRREGKRKKGKAKHNQNTANRMLKGLIKIAMNMFNGTYTGVSIN